MQEGNDSSYADARTREPKYQVMFIETLICCLVGASMMFLPVFVYDNMPGSGTPDVH